MSRLKADTKGCAGKLRSVRPQRNECISLLKSLNLQDVPSKSRKHSNVLKRCQQDDLPIIHPHKRRKSFDSISSATSTPPPTPSSSSSIPSSSREIPIIPQHLVDRLTTEITEQFSHLAASISTNAGEYAFNFNYLVLQFMSPVSPSSEQCTINNPANSRASALTAGPSHHGSSGSTRPVALIREREMALTREREMALTRERKSQAAMRNISPTLLSEVMSGIDDLLRPAKFDRIMNMSPLAEEIQEQHSWNPEDRSLNIYVKEEDKFTFHRHPVARSTDAIRGKVGYSQGFHVWRIEWPEKQRGSHAMVGVATKAASLHATGYTELIGTTQDSYGWDITRGECHHDSKNTTTWRYPFGNSPDAFHVPEKFYCILDMDEGYMAFATDEEYLGVAFRKLNGKTLYPIVATVWGRCEISMRYLGSL